MAILSICIPTKNRDKCLDLTVRSITRQKRFIETNDIEIVISDNGSTDMTEGICNAFNQNIRSKIKYVKMEEPTERAEPNYLNVLKHGTGEFLKLHNDNMICEEGSLDKMCTLIETHRELRPVLFFTNNPDPRVAETIICSGFDSFITHASYMCTWIGGFGVWRSKLPKIEPIFLRMKHTLLVQVDMLTEMIKNKEVVIYNKWMFPDIRIEKGGLNIAEVFGNNYLDLIYPFTSAETFQEERKKVLPFILEHYFGNKNKFQRTGFFKHMKHFWHDDFFYEEIEKLILEGNHAK